VHRQTAEALEFTRQHDTDATSTDSIRLTRGAEVSFEVSSIPTNLKNQPNRPAKKQGSEHVAETQPSWSINKRTPNLPESPQTAGHYGLFA
jgi:hypothetical protein